MADLCSCSRSWQERWTRERRTMARWPAQLLLLLLRYRVALAVVAIAMAVHRLRAVESYGEPLMRARGESARKKQRAIVGWLHCWPLLMVMPSHRVAMMPPRRPLLLVHSCRERTYSDRQEQAGKREGSEGHVCLLPSLLFASILRRQRPPRRARAFRAKPWAC